MHIRPHTLSLITTHQCTAACDHCCFHCSPKVTASIPIPRLHKLIAEAQDIPSIRVVVFTGGECFLLKTELDSLVREATALGYSTRCVTNGYWAVTERAARDRIRAIASAGLKEINFSTGTFHSEFVPVERIRFGIEAAVEAGILTLVNVEIFNESDFNVQSFLDNDRFRSWIAEGRLIVQQGVWIKNDGLVKITHPDIHSRFQDDRLSGCKTALNVVAVTPTQNVMACCGLHMEKIPELRLGSIADRTLKEALDQAEDDFLKIWIHVAGPERILNHVKDLDPSYPLPISSPHPCESCLHLYTDSRARQILKDNPVEMTPVLNMFVAGIAQQHIETSVRNKIFTSQV